jgi:hypothetical protein
MDESVKPLKGEGAQSAGRAFEKVRAKLSAEATNSFVRQKPEIPRDRAELTEVYRAAYAAGATWLAVEPWMEVPLEESREVPKDAAGLLEIYQTAFVAGAAVVLRGVMVAADSELRHMTDSAEATSSAPAGESRGHDLSGEKGTQGAEQHIGQLMNKVAVWRLLAISFGVSLLVVVFFLIRYLDGGTGGR